MKNTPLKKRSKFFAAIKAAIAVATLALCGAVGSAHAQTMSIPVVNSSFETGDLTGFGSTTASGYAAFIAVNDSATQSGYYANYTNPLPSPGQGSHYLSMKGNSQGGNKASDVFQDVGALAANTTYTLTVAVGDNRFHYNNEAFISLLNGTNDTGLTLSSTSISGYYRNTGPAGGTFTDYTTTFTTGSSVSGDLTLEVATASGYGDGQNDAGRNFDNIRLTATNNSPAVPEPSSVSLMLLGAAGLAWGLRRKMANS